MSSFPASSGLNDHPCIAKYDGAGNFLWSKQFGDAADQGAIGVGTDAMGNIYVVGNFKGTLDLGAGPLVSAGEFDVFLAKLSPNGSVIWNARYGDGASQNGSGISVAPQGNLSIGGWFAGSLAIGGTTLVSAGATDVFTTKLDTTGGPIWSKSAGDGLDQLSNDVALDSGGNTITVGDFGGKVDFGGGPLVCAGSRDAFVAKLSP